MALVEFALVLPFLLVIVFGMIDLGKAVSYWNDETHLANQAARYAAVNTCAACDSASKTINTYVPAQAETNELATNATLAIEFTGTGPKNHCTGQPVKVTVSYNYNFLGFVSQAINFIGPIQITASATSRLEQNWGNSSGMYRPDDYVPGSATDRYQATNATADSCT